MDHPNAAQSGVNLEETPSNAIDSDDYELEPLPNSERQQLRQRSKWIVGLGLLLLIGGGGFIGWRLLAGGAPSQPPPPPNSKCRARRLKLPRLNGNLSPKRPILSEP
uniref:Uncharacterized protein n=1 Tax=Desertifilum tharense IPPAS B-1220 TaxID=1781255 RepID=A0ACD5GZD2_9CYAN